MSTSFSFKLILDDELKAECVFEEYSEGLLKRGSVDTDFFESVVENAVIDAATKVTVWRK